MIGLFSVRSPQPFVVDGIVSVEGLFPLRALDGRVVLRPLQIPLRQQQLHVAILLIFGRGRLQFLNGPHIIAGLVGAPPRFERCFLLGICRRRRRARDEQDGNRPIPPLNHSTVPEKRRLPWGWRSPSSPPANPRPLVDPPILPPASPS